MERHRALTTVSDSKAVVPAATAHAEVAKLQLVLVLGKNSRKNEILKDAVERAAKKMDAIPCICNAPSIR